MFQPIKVDSVDKESVCLMTSDLLRILIIFRWEPYWFILVMVIITLLCHSESVTLKPRTHLPNREHWTSKRTPCTLKLLQSVCKYQNVSWRVRKDDNTSFFLEIKAALRIVCYLYKTLGYDKTKMFQLQRHCINVDSKHLYCLIASYDFSGNASKADMYCTILYHSFLAITSRNHISYSISSKTKCVFIFKN